ncbi:hypothetical protein SAMN05216249_1275 [Acetitomaculum ruminis DSM 5522]|uniref:DUF2225 domain-containing protein n=1 Tax=Acetitomaculum ruminis DSM 5522 TaxID=1120918 RepID=A0A1I1AGP8_9FIRM|nr:DUF2225 domain-containing protein [Acetitomaculum ruminis]SFB37117.1 hypothetical protein SAMN05216249_1275 [Acetitomaculum ruminis DSM 5522]
MDNLFSGLEKFGINLEDDDLKVFEEEKKPAQAAAAKGPVVHEEKEFILDKSLNCPLCGGEFKSKIIRAGKAKRLESDWDLRPRFKDFDGNKYGVTLCTNCGYTALDRYFKALPVVKEKLIKEKISSTFKPEDFTKDSEIYDHDMSIARYKMALLNTIVKKGAVSERAYICLKTAWVIRGKIEDLNSQKNKLDKAAADFAQKAKEIDDKIKECEKEENSFLANAYEGFTKAVATESFPMCGMGEATVDYLIAVLAMKFKKYATASKTIANILQSKTAGKQIKEKAFDRKEELVKMIHEDKNS